MVFEFHLISLLLKHLIPNFCLAKCRYGFVLDYKTGRACDIATHSKKQLWQQAIRTHMRHILQHKDLHTEALTLHMGTEGT